MSFDSEDLPTSPPTPSLIIPSESGVLSYPEEKCRARSTALASACAGHVGASYGEKKDGKEMALFHQKCNYKRGAGACSRRAKYRESEPIFNADEFAETDECQELPEGAPGFSVNKCERNVARPRRKRFKKGVQQHVCNNERMHPCSRHRGVFLDYAKFAEKYPFLKPHVCSARFGQCRIDFHDPIALYFFSKAILKDYYDLEFELPVDEKQKCLIPCVPSRANYLHHIADLLIDVDVEASACLKGEILRTRHDERSSDSSLKSTNTTLPSSKSSSCSSLDNKVCRGVDLLSDAMSSSPSSSGRSSSFCSTPLNSSSSCYSSSTNCERATSKSGNFPGVCSCSRTADKAAWPLQGKGIIVLDVGVGANCIYPLLGVREYEWEFVGSDVSEVSLAVAQQNVRLNALEKRISLRLQPSRNNYFFNVVDAGEFYVLTMCNPPFHSSRKEINVCPVRTLEAQDHELICEGGELQFISNMIEESRSFCAQVLWFTTLVARAATVKELKKLIWGDMRNFCHRKTQQEKLMERLWTEQIATVKGTGGQSGEEKPAKGLMEVLRREMPSFEACESAAVLSAGGASEGANEKQRKEETDGPTYDFAEKANQKAVPDVSGKLAAETQQENQKQVEAEVRETAFAFSSISVEKQGEKECKGTLPKYPVHISEFRVKELFQGKQTRWAVCWTYWTAAQRKVVRSTLEARSLTHDSTSEAVSKLDRVP